MKAQFAQIYINFNQSNPQAILIHFSAKQTFQAFPAGRRGVNVSADNVDFPLIFQRVFKEVLFVIDYLMFAYEIADLS